MPKNAKPNRKKNAAPKHFAQLDATGRAMADQSVREVLLAIVYAQGKKVRIPIADLDRISSHSRLVLTVDHAGGFVELKAETHKMIEIEKPKPKPGLIGTIGHIDHGKTSLAAAVTKALAEGVTNLQILDESPAPMDPATFEASKPN